MTAIKYIGKIWWLENVYSLYVCQTQKPEDLKRHCWWQWKRITQISSCGGGGSSLWTRALQRGPTTVFLQRPYMPCVVSIGKWVMAGQQGRSRMGSSPDGWWIPCSPSQNFLRTALLSDSSYPVLPCPLPFTSVRLCLFLPFVLTKVSPLNLFHV